MISASPSYIKNPVNLDVELSRTLAITRPKENRNVLTHFWLIKLYLRRDANEVI